MAVQQITELATTHMTLGAHNKFNIPEFCPVHHGFRAETPEFCPVHHGFRAETPDCQP